MTKLVSNTAIILSLGLALAAACGETTTGHAVVLKTRVTTDLQADRTFTTGLGWRVTLTKAAVSTGAFYYFDGAPAFVSAPSRWRRVLAALAPVGSAHAHPGHYTEGSALGQMLTPSSFDVLGAAVEYPAGSGVTGLVRSATFSIASPTNGPAVTALGGHVAIAEGMATKGSATIYFSLSADLADITPNAKDGKVDGCVFAEHEVTSDGTVTVTVKPSAWLGFVDFSELAPGTASAPTVAPHESNAHLTFALGLTQLAAYQFAYTSP